jgi:methionyl-tRNA formyltransferase
MKVGFLVSGALGYTVINYFINTLNIHFVFTDKKSKNIIELCYEYKIPVYVGNPRNNCVNDFIRGLECDVLASINYIFIIDKNIIDIAKGLCFNVHGSLLPKYRGRTPHVWSLINGEKQTGITAHVIDEGCDTGPIISQTVVDINIEDTGATILDKFKLLYIPIVTNVLEKFKAGKIELIFQDETKASFYGKRTPEDGLIDWNWSFDRIINWVRAQSYPYPGAFTFYNNTKVTIDKVSKSDLNPNYLIQNGTIISGNPLLVKCQNSILVIDSIRDNHFDFKINEKLC